MSVSNSKKPLILKRMLLKSQTKLPMKSGHNINSKLIKLATIPLYREDVIFESKGESFLPGEYQSLTITNELNNLTNNCKTKVRCVTHEEEIIEKTSDNITHLIGQEAYNTLFYALCSVINLEYRIKAILSILTVKEAKDSNILEITSNFKKKNTRVHKLCQTDETRLEIKKKRPRRRVRKIQVPYVVKPEAKLKKITIDPFKGHVKSDKDKIEFDAHINSPSDLPIKEFKTESVDATGSTEPKTSSSESNSILPDLGYLHDDNSNDSNKSFSTIRTFKTTSDLLINPISIINEVVKHTEDNPVIAKHPIILMDKTQIYVPFKPQDNFHIATKENLQYLDAVNRKKLLLHQMQIDYRFCLTPIDEDRNLPIHEAVINNDLELVKRQCVVLRIRNQNVDIPAGNGLTALKLSLFHESVDATRILLQHGADPLLDDEEHSTCVHLAAELKTDHLSIILHHCKMNARTIIIHHVEELQTPGWENKTDEELGTLVLHHLCTLFDKSGYTPLMLASKLGHYENVRLLVESVPHSVQLTMPTCGNTALFLAVAAACTVSAGRGNKSKVVDHFRKTIEILLDAGADPSLDNHGGSNVNLLLQEFNCTELSMLVANKVTYMKYFNGEEDYSKDFNKYLLIKEGDTVSIKEMNNRKKDDKSMVAKEEKKEFEKNKKAGKRSVTIEVDKKPGTVDVGNNNVDLKSVKKESNRLDSKETGNKLITKETGNKLVTKDVGKSLLKKDVGNIIVTKEVGNKLITKEAGNKIITKDLGKSLIKIDVGKMLVTKDIGKSILKLDVSNTLVAKDVSITNVTEEVGNTLVTKEKEVGTLVTKDAGITHVREEGNALVTKDAGKILLKKRAGDKLVTKDVGKILVTKDIGNKLITKETFTKPIITENLLIKNSSTSVQDKDKISVESKVNTKDIVKPCYKMETIPSVKKIIWYPPKRKAETHNEDVKRPKNT